MGCRFEDHLEALRSKIDDNPPELIIIESHSLYGPVYNETRSRKVLKYLPTSLINFLSVRSEWDRVKYLVRDVIRERSLLEVSPRLVGRSYSQAQRNRVEERISKITLSIQLQQQNWRSMSMTGSHFLTVQLNKMYWII